MDFLQVGLFISNFLFESKKEEIKHFVLYKTLILDNSEKAATQFTK